MYQLCMAVLGPPWWPWHVRVRMCVYACVCVCLCSLKCVLVFRSSLSGHSCALDQEGDCGRRSFNQPTGAHPVSHCLHSQNSVRTYVHTYVRKFCIYICIWLIDTIACEPPCTNLQWCHCIHTYIPIRTYMLLIIKCTLMFHLGKDMYLHTWYVVKRTLLVRKWPVLSVPPAHLQSVHICFSTDMPRRLRF